MGDRRTNAAPSPARIHSSYRNTYYQQDTVPRALPGAPGTPPWLLAAPSVTSAEVTLAGGATLRVTAPAAGTGATRARALRWGTETLAHPRMTQAQIGRGGELVMELE